jgi:hypothetical protein
VISKYQKLTCCFLSGISILLMGLINVVGCASPVPANTPITTPTPVMKSDGTDGRNITLDYFPAAFLCHRPIISVDDSRIFFVGQWWD